MEPVNKSGRRKRGRRKTGLHKVRSAAGGYVFPAVGSPWEPLVTLDGQNQSLLHSACMDGHLATVQHLVESGQDSINSSDVQGRRPLHMVLSFHSSPNTSCLIYLLEHGADVNVATDSGMTPLHMSASKGFLDYTKLLVQAGAEVSAQDNMGLTALDLARVLCRREVARYLRDCKWHEDKTTEMHKRKQIQALYEDLVDMAKFDNSKKKVTAQKTLSGVKTLEWTSHKGLPPLKDVTPRAAGNQYHTMFLPPIQRSSSPRHAKQTLKHQPGPPWGEKRITHKQQAASFSGPWTIFMGLQPERPPAVPDLRDKVLVWRESSSKKLHYSTEWDRTPRPTPDLPLDVVQRVFFPRAFPSRIPSPHHFEPQGITEVQHRRNPKGRSSSPWTEVAMHLAEVLEPGHY
ncbi:uncharacterized protein V6R79_001463 [Siganus canaliculatus]